MIMINDINNNNDNDIDNNDDNLLEMCMLF